MEASASPSHPLIRILIFCALVSNLCGADLEVTNLWPASQSSNNCADTPLRLEFNQPVALTGKGRISVHRVIDNQTVDAFDFSATEFTNRVGGKTLRYDPLTIAGNKATLQLHSQALKPGETFYVNIEPGVFKSDTGSEFGGIVNNTNWRFSTHPPLPKGRAKLIVAVDGGGDFCTPQGAIDYVPDDNQSLVEIFVREGLYQGLIYIAPDKSHIHVIGEKRKGTIMAGRNNDRLNSGRMGRPLMSVDANDFVLENITLRNTTPYGGSQAEAFCARSDRCVLRNDDFYSFQDTLLLSGSVYVTNCYVEGDVDFIWGQGSVFFDRSEIKAVHKGYYLQARNGADRIGYVFYQCKLTAAAGVGRCLLARIDADRFPYSEAVFIDCQMNNAIPPIGWEIKGTNLTHINFAEYHSTDLHGKPVDFSQRHPASRQLIENEAVELSDPAHVLSAERKWNRP